MIPISPLPEEKDYNKKQLKAVELIKEIVVGCYHNHIAYGESKKVLKSKRLGKAFTDEELYWIATELWTVWMTSGKAYSGEFNKAKGGGN